MKELGGKGINMPVNKKEILNRLIPEFSSVVSCVIFCYVEQQPDKVVLLTRKGHISGMSVFTPDQVLEEAAKFESDINGSKYNRPELFELTFLSKEELVSHVRELVLNASLNHFARDSMLEKVNSLDNTF